MDQGREHPGAAGPDGVPKGDATTADVELLFGHAEVLDVGEDLGGEGLVDLEDVDLRGQAGGGRVG